MALFTCYLIYLARAFFVSLVSNLSTIFDNSTHFSSPLTGIMGNLIPTKKSKNLEDLSILRFISALFLILSCLDLSCYKGRWISCLFEMWSRL